MTQTSLAVDPEAFADVRHCTCNDSRNHYHPTRHPCPYCQYAIEQADGGDHS